jgi:TRAP-type mannitol/chloroaromatic compound transport system substrate-binding protein
MKNRLIVVLVTLMLMIGLVVGACAPAPTPAPPTPAPPTPAPPTPAPEVEVIKWKMQSSWAGALLQELAEGFANRVTELSGGRLEIECLVGGSIVGPFEVLDATSAGTLDCYHSWPGYWLGTIPSAPFFGGDTAFASGPIPWITWLYEGGGEELMLEAWRDKGFNVGTVEVLGLRAPEVFAWSNKPLVELEDFEGLTFRISGYWAEVFEGIGAAVVTLPGAEVLTALERGTIDATEWGVINEDWAVGLQDACDYAVLTAFRQAYPTFDFAVNKDSWEALPPDLQQLIKTVCKEYTYWYLTVGTYRDVMMMDQLEEKVTITVLDKEVPDEMYRLMGELYDKIGAEDPMTAKAVASAKAFQDEYNYYAEKMYPYVIK